MMRDTALVVRIPSAIKAALEALARTERRSLSDISNFALQEYVEAKSGPITEEKDGEWDDPESEDPDSDQPAGMAQ